MSPIMKVVFLNQSGWKLSLKQFLDQGCALLTATQLASMRGTQPIRASCASMLFERSMFDVAPDLQRFYQAEVLVPSPLPRHLIIIPSKPVKMRKKHLPAGASSKTTSAAVEGGDLSTSDPTLAESAMVCGARRSSSKSSSSAFSTAS